MTLISLRLPDELLARIDRCEGTRSAVIRSVLEEKLGGPEPLTHQPQTSPGKYDDLPERERRVRELRDELIAQAPHRADSARRRAEEQLGYR